MTEHPPADAAPSAGAPRAEEGASTPGLLNRLRGNRTALLVGGGTVLLLVLGTGSLLAGVAVASNRSSPDPVDTLPADTAARPLPDVVPGAVPLRTCSVAEEAADSELKRLHAAALRLTSGGSELLFGRRAETPAPTGGVMKLYTAAAALAKLGADYRISTSVVEGSVPGSVVLVGRGDATLSRLPEGQQSVYRDAPKLASLAAQTVANWAASHPGETITSLVIDANYWNPGDNWVSSWPSSARAQGVMPFITALQVDGDRDDPKKASSPRSDDPIGRASAAFLAALVAADPGGTIVDPSATISSGGADPAAALLAEVQSQPVLSLVEYMLTSDDNTLAEMLARIVSQRSNLDGSAASVGSAISGALTVHEDLDMSRLVVADGSGMSPENRMTMTATAGFLALIWDGEHGLSDIRDTLSVAGASGSLAERFTGTGAAGNVSAKTSRMGTAAAMAGIVEAEDGALIAFTVAVVRDGVGSSAWGAIDALVTGFYECGSNLANV